jgi:hypothetical protein
MNGFVERVLLHGAIENLPVIDASVVQAVVDDHATDEAINATIITDKPGRGGPLASAVRKRADAPTLQPDSNSDHVTLDLAARTAMLEAQVEEQGVALRRVLTLLIDWVEHESGVAPSAHSVRSPAA